MLVLRGKSVIREKVMLDMKNFSKILLKRIRRVMHEVRLFESKYFNKRTVRNVQANQLTVFSLSPYKLMGYFNIGFLIY